MRLGWSAVNNTDLWFFRKSLIFREIVRLRSGGQKQKKGLRYTSIFTFMTYPKDGVPVLVIYKDIKQNHIFLLPLTSEQPHGVSRAVKS